MRTQSGELKPKTGNTLEPSENDLRFLSFCRRLEWGSMVILVKNGEPVMGKVVSREYRFDTALPDDIEIIASEVTNVSWKSL